jgi:hypothetical protein
MPRQKSLITVIRDLVRDEVGAALGSILGTGKPKPKNGRRKRRGKWKPGGPGRPPKNAVVTKTPKRSRRSPKKASAAS